MVPNRRPCAVATLVVPSPHTQVTLTFALLGAEPLSLRVKIALLNAGWYEYHFQNTALAYGIRSKASSGIANSSQPQDPSIEEWSENL